MHRTKYDGRPIINCVTCQAAGEFSIDRAPASSMEKATVGILSKTITSNVTNSAFADIVETCGPNFM
jgi:hypothetical protein